MDSIATAQVRSILVAAHRESGEAMFKSEFASLSENPKDARLDAMRIARSPWARERKYVLGTSSISRCECGQPHRCNVLGTLELRIQTRSYSERYDMIRRRSVSDAT